MNTKQSLIKSVRFLVKVGQELLSNRSQRQYANFDFIAYSRLRTGCKNLLRVLGDAGEPWRRAFISGSDPVVGQDTSTAIYEGVDAAMNIVGGLQSLEDAIKGDLLVKIELLVAAETFENLLEQAEHLLSTGYFLAAGVLGRAVLEEHLRKWCQRARVSPKKAKPTMSDYYGALYPAHLNKLVLKQIEAMAAIGNAAAHNDITLHKEDVERLLRDLRGFLTANPIK